MILQKLKDYYKNTPEDQIKKDWEKFAIFDEEGVTVNEFLKSNGKQATN